MAYILFVSDVHLNQTEINRTEHFLRFLKKYETADAIYILGDLFDIWVGDDERSALSETIQDALSKLKTNLYFIAGNHDFLLSRGFANRTNLRILPDPFVTEIYNTKVLLSHGDLFCTDDQAYMRYRRWTSSIILQSIFLLLPWRLRCWIAKRLQQKSNTENQKKSKAVMDVNEVAVVASLKEYQCNYLIHGHTHRPMVHDYPQNKKRIVLGSWENEGEFLKWDDTGEYALCKAIS